VHTRMIDTNLIGKGLMYKGMMLLQCFVVCKSPRDKGGNPSLHAPYKQQCTRKAPSMFMIF
jgi:hypothetical protein